MSTTRRTLVAPAELEAHLDDPSWVVLDCRFSLADPEAGAAAYAEGHIPGARYAHLEHDLSGPVGPGTGRHPLPDPVRLGNRFGAWGIEGATQVVAYDAADGSMAARAWWLLNWLGHDAVAVLDGGWGAWLVAAAPVSTAAPTVEPRAFVARPRPELVVDAADVERMRGAPGSALLDVRTTVRFRGAEEPIDPVAGHIPGAESAPYGENLGPDGHWLGPQALRARYRALLRGRAARETVFYCGSGVTAAHGVLAMRHAGLGEARLYAGSWSEWIADPERPVAVGADPFGR